MNAPGVELGAATMGQELEVPIKAKDKKKQHKKEKETPPDAEAVVVSTGAYLAPVVLLGGAVEVEVPIQAKVHKKTKAKEPCSGEGSSSNCGVEMKELHCQETGNEHAHQRHDEGHKREKEELPESKLRQIEEKVKSLHSSSQAMGVAIKKAIRFTVASASMFGPEDEIEEEFYTDQAIYHTSKALNASIVIADHSPLIFHRIRCLAGVTLQQYLNSWLETPLDDSKLFKKAASGKSGSLFLFSADGRFIIKTLPSKEGRTLIRMLPAYYQHLLDNPQSMLCRLLGYYAIEVGGHTHYLVMQRNIFWNAPPFSEIYDLKGSTRGRKSTEEEKKKGGSKCVLKDLDFIEVERRISLPPSVKEEFLRAIKSDSEFLVPSNLIDYSLLIGIHKNEPGNEDCKHDKKKKKKKKKRHGHHHGDDEIAIWKGGVESADGSEVYYMGIIDFLSPYATKKKMAHLFKRGVLLNEAAALSSVPADYYASRFLNLITTTILA